MTMTCKRDQHVPLLLSSMQSLLVDTRQFCNVTLRCQNGNVQAPGILLAAVSPLFRQLGVWEMEELDISLPDFKAGEMLNFVRRLLMPFPLKKDEESFEEILGFLQISTNSSQFFHLEDPIEENETYAKSEEEDFEEYDDEDDLSFSEEESKPKKKYLKRTNKLSSEAKSTYDPDLKLYVCPHCHLQLKAGMTNHLKWHREHPEEIYPSRSTCEHCGKTFKKIGILRAHIVRMHSNMPKKFKCSYEGCERAFKMRGELNTHYLIHTNAKNFICTECGLGFRTKMAMDSHTLRKHTNLKPSIPCEECGKLFKVKSDLYSHAMTHKARKERIHRCDDCNLTFRTEKSLQRHLELHDPTRPLACHKCPLRYKNKDQLVRHVQTHEKPDIECELCHRVFGRPDHLKRHIATKHASLSVVEQMYLSESINKKKQKQTKQPQQPPPIQPVHVLQKLEPLPDRPESELSTISVADIGTSTFLPLQAAPSTNSVQENQYRNVEYSPMFHLSLPTQPTNQDENVL